MGFRNRKRLGDILVEMHKITPEQLDIVLKKQKETEGRVGQILIEMGFITEDDILEALRLQLDLERVHFETLSIDVEAVKKIPEAMANKYNLIAVSIDSISIIIVTSDPLNIVAIDDVRMYTGHEVEVKIAGSEEVKTAISKYYSGQQVKKAADDLSKEHVVDVAQEQEIKNAEDLKDAPAVRLVDSIVANAVKARASDIHIEPFENYIKIRYRIDGELEEVLRPSKDTLGALVTRIKILANLNIAEKRVPQDGRIMTKVDDKDIDLRVSILPTVSGEKVVIRILNKTGFMISRKDLGIEGEEFEKLNNMIKSPYGIILVTGPTGSGKSTTLYSLLNDLNKNDRNIVTIEDPVEYMMDGINQVNVNVKAGMTFASGLRSILRQDPDIIMIGEIRDAETAEIAIRAAITGHLVLSTIHTNDAPSAVIRLTDMGIEPYLVATSVAGVISQRLVRKICPYCAASYEATNYEKRILGVDERTRLVLKKGTGCPHCGSAGYAGRRVVYEIMEIGRKHREQILNSQNTDELRDLCIKNGMKTLKASCRDLVMKGITTTDEMIKIAYLKE